MTGHFGPGLLHSLEAQWREACRQDELMSRAMPPPAADLLADIDAALASPVDDASSVETSATVLLQDQGSVEIALLQMTALGKVFAQNLGDDAQILAPRLVSVVGRASIGISLRRTAVLEEELELDVTTGVASKHAFNRDLAAEVEKCMSTGSTLVLGMTDLDGLKQVNDRDGHPAGDALLRRFASGLDEALPEGCRAYRWGGDEFAALFPGFEAAAAQDVIQKLHEGDGPAFGFGLASCPQDATSAEELEAAADSRLTDMKNATRGTSE
jgi:GGDEF domain-containing protein